MDSNVATAAAHAQPPSSPSPTLGSIANRWRELHGARSWQGLLDPIDNDLRAFIIAYGEHAATAYDGFNTERRSPHVGCCLYSHDDLLVACGVSCPGNYKVTKFLYASPRLASAATQAATETSIRLSSSATQVATEPFFVRPLCEDEESWSSEANWMGRPLCEDEESWWSEVNWMGYVAVATDEGVTALGRRDIAVVWRGSVTRLEYFKDIDWLFAHAETVLGPAAAAAHKDARVHHGFLSVYTSRDETSDHGKTSVQDQVRGEVRRLMQMYKDEVTSITVTGHSLGASLATLNAVDMVAHGVNVPPASSEQPPRPVTAILFASPRVGNRGFKAAFASFPDLRALSVKNKGDPVPSLPPSVFGYVDATTAALPIDTNQSPYLLRGDIFSSHNLEVYLHGVAGYHGDGTNFSLVVNRDVVLVNKWADLVKDKRSKPANWWVCRGFVTADAVMKRLGFEAIAM